MMKRFFLIFFVAMNVSFLAIAHAIEPFQQTHMLPQENKHWYRDSAARGFLAVFLADIIGFVGLLALEKRSGGAYKGLYKMSDVARKSILLLLLVGMGFNEGSYSAGNAAAFLIGASISIFSPILGAGVALFSFMSKHTPAKPKLINCESDVQK